jgi:hypothetical protein
MIITQSNPHRPIALEAGDISYPKAAALDKRRAKTQAPRLLARE